MDGPLGTFVPGQFPLGAAVASGSVGAAAGLGAAAAGARKISRSAATAAGLGSAAAAPLTHARSAATAAGLGTAAAAGRTTVRATAAAAGTGSAAAAGLRKGLGSAAATSLGAATAASKAMIQRAASAASAGTAAAASNTIKRSLGATAGQGQTAATGKTISRATATAAALGSAAATIRAVVRPVGSAAGLGTARSSPGIGQGIAAGLGSAAAASRPHARSAATAAGLGAIAAAGKTTARATATAAGTGVAAPVGKAFIRATGVAAGQGAAPATSRGVTRSGATGSAAGHSTTQSAGLTHARSIGLAAGAGGALAFVTSRTGQGRAAGSGIAAAIGGATSFPLEIAAAPLPPLPVDQYLELITAEHNQRPRFMATVELSTRPYVDSILTALSLIGLFDLDTAVGQQLDMLGQWVGITRDIIVESDVWFSFDEPRIGFDQAQWITPYETVNKSVRLDDQHYRLVLRGRIASNHWDGTLPGAYAAWNTLFAETGYQILIQDSLARAERDFSFDSPVAGFDQSLWYKGQPIAHIYFSFDDPDLLLGLDQGAWYGPPGTALTQAWARTNGNMHLIEALLGPPLDPITLALFTGGYLTLKSAGVQIDYMTQNQGAGPEVPDGISGIGLPLFALDAGPGDKGYWMSYDNPAAGLDEAPLFYPGAHPIDPDFAPVYLTLDGNDPASGLDAGWWTPPMRPDYLVLDSTDPVHELDTGEWYTPGAYAPPLLDPDEPLPPTGVEFPPTTLAGFDLGAFAELVGTS